MIYELSHELIFSAWKVAYCRVSMYHLDDVIPDEGLLCIMLLGFCFPYFSNLAFAREFLHQQPSMLLIFEVIL
jgi:hypothetical protein